MPNSSSQLELLRSVADGIAALFFPNAEVVIHDLATNKIAYLANNLSKRKPGDDAGLEDFELDGGAGVTGPYEKLNWDGKKMRSVSIAARDEQGKPSYLLCINLSTAMFEDARNALDMFLSVTRLQPQPQQLFKDDWQEKINTFLHDWLRRENAANKNGGWSAISIIRGRSRPKAPRTTSPTCCRWGAPRCTSTCEN